MRRTETLTSLRRDHPHGSGSVRPDPPGARRWRLCNPPRRGCEPERGFRTLAAGGVAAAEGDGGFQDPGTEDF